MLPDALWYLDEVARELQRLAALKAATRAELKSAIEQIELARAAARISGEEELAARLEDAASCLLAAAGDPGKARRCLVEASHDLAALCQARY